MTPARTVDVAIVGAGPAGTTLAAASRAARRGGRGPRACAGLALAGRRRVHVTRGRRGASSGRAGVRRHRRHHAADPGDAPGDPRRVDRPADLRRGSRAGHRRSASTDPRSIPALERLARRRRGDGAPRGDRPGGRRLGRTAGTPSRHSISVTTSVCRADRRRRRRDPLGRRASRGRRATSATAAAGRADVACRRSATRRRPRRRRPAGRRSRCVCRSGAACPARG